MINIIPKVNRADMIRCALSRFEAAEGKSMQRL